MEYKNLIESHCHKCGIIGESKLTWAGPHIKQSCDNCGFYQKFYDKSLIPDVKEIKIEIWRLVKSDLYEINRIKSEINFDENLTGLDSKLQYYELFKAIKNKK